MAEAGKSLCMEPCMSVKLRSRGGLLFMLVCRALNIGATHCSMSAALPLWEPLLLAGQGLIVMEGLIFRQWLIGGWFERSADVCRPVTGQGLPATASAKAPRLWGLNRE